MQWLPMWLAAVVVAGVGVSLWTVGWRARGFTPGVPNSASVWAAMRARVSTKSVVILGSSRAQAAIDPIVWEEVWPERPVYNLALVATSPVPVLEHVAQDRSFSGIAVVGFAPFFVFNVDQNPSIFLEAAAAYDEYRLSPSRRLETWIRQWLPSAIPLRHPTLNWRSLVGGAVLRVMPDPPDFTTRDDRFQPLARDYREHPLGSDDYEQFRLDGRQASPFQRDSILRRVQSSVDAIQRRGGTVLFVMLPTCGERRSIENERYPQTEYWDVAQQVLDAPFLSDVHAELNGDSWRCAEGSHLYVGDTGAFTRWLASTVRSIVDDR